MNGSRIVGLVRKAIGVFNTARRQQRRSSGDRRGTSSGTGRRTTGQRPPEQPRPSSSGSRSNGRPDNGAAPAASADTEMAGARIEYSPTLDGDADPGEVVWTWVPYEDDPTQGKDRPVMIFGRRGNRLVGVALTSKHHDNEPQMAVGTGSWDREGRESYAKLERILDVDPAQVRREGAVLSKPRFDEVVIALRKLHGLVERPR